MIFISGWVMSILGIVILGTVFDLLLEKSRLKNFIRAIFATVSVLVIITPLPTIVKNGVDVNFSDMLGEIALDDGFIDYADNLKVDALENAVEKSLASDGIVGAKIHIVGTVEKNDIVVKSVSVDLSESVIKENIANINKYEFIRERVKSFLESQEVEIFING